MISKIVAQDGMLIPWAEFISKEGYTQDYDFSVNESGAVFKVITSWSTIDDFIGAAMGYSYTDTGVTPIALRRITPMRHPRRYWMRASRIQSVRPVKWLGKVPGSGYGNISDYKFGIVSIYFTNPRYEILPDADTTAEYQRYCTRTFAPSVEILTLDQGGFQFVVAGGGVPNGQAARVPTGMKVSKLRIAIKWWQVPDTYLYGKNGSNNGGVPNNLLACQGRVNNASFLNYPAGTLYCEAPQVEEWSVPVDPATAMRNVPNANLLSVARTWNVTIPLNYFDPPPATGVTYQTRGWNTAPWPNGLWYPIANKLDLTMPLLGGADFTTMFKPNTN